MSTFPLSTILIASGLLLFSIMVGGRMTRMVRGAYIVALSLASVLLFVSGLVLHVGEPVREKEGSVGRREERSVPHAGVTFSPASVRRGQEVEIRIEPFDESATVYFNGRPLPKRIDKEAGTFRVTIPSTGRTDYVEIDVKGKRIHSSEQLTVIP